MTTSPDGIQGVNGENGNGGNFPPSSIPASPFDVGISFGTTGTGTGGEDLKEITFVLSHATDDLTLEHVSKEDFGARLQSVGLVTGNRGDSLKLWGAAPEVPTGSLGSRVWIDHGDGVQEAAETTGVKDVVVYLLKADGTSVLDGNGQPVFTKTLADGNYKFENLPVGEYKVRFDLPEPYKTSHQFTTANTGGETLDSDVDATVLVTHAFTVSANTFNDTADAGIVLKPADNTPAPDPEGYDDLIEGGADPDWIFGGMGSDEMQG